MKNWRLVRIAVSALLLIAAMVIEHTCKCSVGQLLFVYLLPFLLVGYDVIGNALENLLKGKVFNEDLLMCIATLGAFCIGFFPGAETEYAEAVFVMLFFQIGELFEDYAEGKSRKSISHLMDIRPDVANVLRDGKIVQVSPAEIAIGESIVVKPGEKVPLDGCVTEGSSSLNTLALTGESLPREVSPGDEVFSGCVNISGVLTICVKKVYAESTVSKIIDMVENAGEKKSKSETFIAKFARVYTPVVVFAALVLAFLPPLFASNYLLSFPEWLYRALTFLIVSCPCALVISVPLAFFGGIGGASKNGILIKGGRYMDTLSRAGVVVFDKTGTLTKGRFEVTAVHPENISETQLLHLAAHVEHLSTHPIAISLRNAFPNVNDGCVVKDIEEIAGQGVRASVNGKIVCVGNSRLMDSIGAKWHTCHMTGSIIHVAMDGLYLGHIVISDQLKDDALEAVKDLRELAAKKIVMLTGDRKDVGEHVAAVLGLDECHTELLPADKVAIVERLMSENDKKHTLLFVGDGINDAPVLARADVGIAMGGLGSDAAIEAADVVLMDDKLTKIAKAILLSRGTIRIAMENVIFAIGVKLLVLLLATVGCATLWMAVFADVGVTVLAVLNAMRAYRCCR